MHVFDLKKFIDGFVAEVLPRHGRSKSGDRPWFAPTRRDFYTMIAAPTLSAKIDIWRQPANLMLYELVPIRITCLVFHP